jgi:hypothetical protein
MSFVIFELLKYQLYTKRYKKCHELNFCDFALKFGVLLMIEIS